MDKNQQPDYHKAKDAAVKILTEYGYDNVLNKPPVDILAICNDKGIKVQFATFQKEDNNISGFYYSEKDEIYVNSNEFSLRQNFTIAHELGHYILHKDWLASSDYKMLMRSTEHNNNDIKEKEANTFAANLLVPTNFLSQYYKETDVATLSKIFQVSIPVIVHRIKNEFG